MTLATRIAAALLAVGATVLPAASPPAAAQDAAAAGFPNRPIRLIVPFAAGGPSDITARLMAPKMSAALNNQPIVVESRPGAGGVTGVDVAAKAAPDGYTIVLGSAGALAISPGLPDRSMPYDTLRDLAPITLAVLVPEPVVVPASTPFRTMQEFIAAARAQPGRLNYGHTGPAWRTIRFTSPMPATRSAWKSGTKVAGFAAGAAPLRVGRRSARHFGRPPSSTAAFSCPNRRISHQPRAALARPFWS